MRNCLIALVCLLASPLLHAEAPKYEVFTQLRNVVVTYYVEMTTINSKLYAINQETYPVICDASTINNRQEESKGQEVVIAPKKIHPFSFKHSKSVTNLRIYLVCEPQDKSAAATTKETNTPKTEAPATSQTPVQKPLTVIEEDIGAP